LRTSLSFTAFTCALIACATFSLPAAAQNLPRVLMTTSLGEIEMEIDTIKAPLTAKNFLRYVDEGFYNGGRFHRAVTMNNQPSNTVKIEVIQGGVNQEKRAQGYPAIALERTSVTGLSHRDGVVSMARAGPDSATSDFFICIGDQLSLDFGGARNADGQGFAAFGRVTRGMDVVRKIQASPVGGNTGQSLTPPVQITGAKRVTALP
jgi:peptidyl-prolyl cis-trans isomerase A (cyclophilin A)